MTPMFQVLCNNTDITAKIRDRLISIRTTDKPGLESDTCEITIDDRDGLVAMPDMGAILHISLGYEEWRKLDLIGSYKVDEVEVDFTVRTLSIRGKPASLADSMKEQRDHAWENTTLAQIVSDIAARNKLTPLCQIDQAIDRADQINESDMHFITRLAAQYGSTATVKDGRLIVAPRGEGESGSGMQMPSVTIRRRDLIDGKITFSTRTQHKKTQAEWYDPDTGEKGVVSVENESDDEEEDAPTYTERHPYPDEATAKAAAESRQASLNRKTVTGHLDLPGRTDISAEKWLSLQDVKAGVDGVYLIETVEQEYSESGWKTKVEINAGNNPKKKKKKGASGPGRVMSVSPDL